MEKEKRKNNWGLEERKKDNWEGEGRKKKWK